MKKITVTVTVPMLVLESEAQLMREFLTDNEDLAGRLVVECAMRIVHPFGTLVSMERATRTCIPKHNALTLVKVETAEAGPEDVAAYRTWAFAPNGRQHLDRMLRDDAATTAERSAKDETAPIPQASALEADALLSQVLKDAGRSDGGAP
jgi:hypothetical protein